MRKPLFLAAALAVLWLALSAANYFAWVRGADHRDFYPRWAGARLALFERRDLYSEETTRLIQQRLYGGSLPPERDQQGFAYPAQLVPLLLPFWLVKDVELATALWEGLSVLMLGGALYLLRLRGQGGLPAWALLGLVLWYFPLLMVFQGQFTGLALLALAAGWRLFEQKRDWAAGAVLAAGVIKPELAALPCLVMLVLALRGRRWKWLGGFAAAQAVLLGASVLAAGWWLPGWLDALRRYAAYAQPAWAPATAWDAGPLFLLLLGAALALLLWRARWSGRFAFGASIPLGMLLLPQTLIYGLTVLLGPLAMSWRGRARWAVGAAWLLGWSAVLWPVGSWRWQNVLFPLLALGALVLASREEERQDDKDERG